MSSASTGEEVAKRLRRGDAASVRVLEDRVRRILASRPLHLPEEARDDLRQQILTEVWRAVNRAGFDVGGGFWGFVETVAARRCLDWLRSRRSSETLDPQLKDPAPGPLSHALSKERTRLALETLAHLDEPCRRLIFLRAGLAKSYREIAPLLGKREGALRVQMYRCVRTARAVLQRLVAPAPEMEQRKGQA